MSVVQEQIIAPAVSAQQEQKQPQQIKASGAPSKMIYNNTRFTQSEALPVKTDVGALANRINIKTRGVHNKIDKMMTLRFALALRDHKIYRQGLAMYYHVFSAIEFSLEREMSKDSGNKWGSLLEEIWHPAVARKNALYEDLMLFFNNDEKRFAQPLLAKQIEFCEHIKQVTAEKPYLLLAYMHVLYLALFAGGRVLRSDIAKATGFFPRIEGKTHEEMMLYGTNFLRFNVEDEESLRIEYKRNYELNTRNILTEEEKQEVIDESIYIFEQNVVLIKEIESRNLQRLKSKMAYKAAIYSYYAAIVMITMIFIYYAKNLFFSL